MSDQPQPQQQGMVMLAFRQALSEIKPIGRSETADVGKFSYSYAPLGVVLEEVKRACSMYDLAITQTIARDNEYFAVSTMLIHADGSSLSFPASVLPMPREAQALGSAATYLRRYSLLAIFAIATEDDDGKAATVAASTQPGRRTEAERLIREEMSQMSAAALPQFTADFKDVFHMGLSDLPASKHGAALTWTKEWVHSPATVAEPTTGG